MSRSEGVIAFKIEPGKTCVLESPGDIRFSQVAFHDELAESSSLKGRTVLKMKHIRPIEHDHDDDEDHEEDEEEVEGVVTIASLIPGVVETQLLGGLIVAADEHVEFEVSGKNTVHLSGHIIVQPDFDMPPDDSELDEASEADDLDHGEIEGMDEDEQNEFLKALSRSDALSTETPSKSADSPSNKKLTKVEKKALKKEQQAPSSTPAVAVVATTTTTTSTTTTTKTAAASGLDAAIGQKRRASDDDASATTPSKHEGDKKKEAKDATTAPVAKKAKGQDGKPVTKTEAVATPANEKKEKENAKAKKADKSFTTPGGVKVVEKKSGEGAGAKRGQRLQMRYILKLSNGKIADKNTTGTPFSFRLGAGEVIKGWDEGLVGMKVDEERTLEVPPALGYGKKGVQGIPGNSTLFFEVKLLALK